MEPFEVLVVGGGPAGSTTVYRLAEAGASVLLVDRARFPRDKPCGGGVTMRAARRCPGDVAPLVGEGGGVVELRFPLREALVRRGPPPGVPMTPRRRLRALLPP